jgi:hypothetical protein
MALESLNSRAVSWAEILVTINVNGGASLPTIDIKSLDHETKVDVGEQRGAGGGSIRKRTTGQDSATASGTFYRDGAKALKGELAKVAPKDSAGRPRIALVSFDIVIKHSFDDDPSAEIHCTKLLGCRYLKDSSKHAEGTDPETVDVDLAPMKIVEVIDGQDVVLL